VSRRMKAFLEGLVAGRTTPGGGRRITLLEMSRVNTGPSAGGAVPHEPPIKAEPELEWQVVVLPESSQPIVASTSQIQTHQNDVFVFDGYPVAGPSLKKKGKGRSRA